MGGVDGEEMDHLLEEEVDESANLGDGEVDPFDVAVVGETAVDEGLEELVL